MKLPKYILGIFVVAVSASLGLVGTMPAAQEKQETQPASWVITGAMVVDGTGAAPRRANVRVEGDRILRVGDFQPEKSERVVNAAGLVLAPGFVDIHNHSAEGLEKEPLAANQISQGITTVALGPDGSSPWPIGEYLARRRKEAPALNVMMFVGHATVRRQVMGENFRREATAEEVKKMAALVAQGMKEGAVGLSTGLEYEVGSYSSTEEVIELARVAAQHGGIYMSHIRDEADRTFEALREAIRIGQEAAIPVQISHIKMGTVGVHGRAREAVELIEEAHINGIDITADCYPYEAWHSTITVLVPSKEHFNPEHVAKALADVGGAQNLLITRYAKNPEYEFRTMDEIAKSRGITPVELYMEIVRGGGAGLVGRSMIEDDIGVFYGRPWVMISSDGGVGGRHPRAAGTFPKVLGQYVRDRGWLPLEEAIRKSTTLPAGRLGFDDRGVIRSGAAADLVLFNPQTVLDLSTYAEPHILSRGVEKVWVNGELVWDGGKPTKARPGRVLSR